MILDKQAFRIVGLTVGLVFILVGLFAVPAWAQNQQFGDLTAGQCIAIINNDSGNQYNATIIQDCNQILENQDDDGTPPEEEAPSEEAPSEEETSTEDGTGEDVDGDSIVDGSVPSKALPNTGGPPLLGIAFFVLAGAGLLTAVIRRR